MKQIVSTQLQQSLLDSVVELLLRAGLTKAQLRTLFSKSLTRWSMVQTQVGSPPQDGVYLPHADISADVMRLWHRDHRYIDAREAKPRSLHLSKGRNSIRAIILRISPKAEAAAIVRYMQTAGLVRETTDGRYVPTVEAGAITRNDLFVVEHLAKSIARLFSTVRQNTNVRSASRPLIERYAYVSDLSEAESAEFAEFTKNQGLSYLQAVDDWMEQRRTKKAAIGKGRRKPGVVAGVQVVAYLGGRGSDLPDGRQATFRGKSRTEGTDTVQSNNQLPRPNPRRAALAAVSSPRSTLAARRGNGSAAAPCTR